MNPPTATADSAAPKLSRVPVGWRRVLILVAGVLLTVCFFDPPISVLEAKLDPSIFSAYAYYTARGFQFGPEIVAMAGPYGFVMYGNIYGGDLFWLRLFAELAVKGLLAMLVLRFFLRLPANSRLRWLWFPAHVLCTSTLADLSIAWIMLFTAFYLLEPPEKRRGRTWAALLAVSLGLFALFKGTHLMLSFATISVVALAWGWTGNWRRAGWILAAYTAGLVGFWLLARQNPLNLPAYVVGSLHLAASYNSAMSIEEPARIFRSGLGVISGLTLLLGLTAWWRRREPLTVGGLALLMGYTFVMWKHGFVRADNHTVIFFSFVAAVVPAWYLYFVGSDVRVSPPVRAGAALTALLLLVLDVAGTYPPQHSPLAGNPWSSFQSRLSFLAQPGDHKLTLEGRLQQEREMNLLPDTAATIQGASIDYFGTRQGVIPLNRLNYRPRPMGAGTFNVYDRYLMELNRAYLRDPARRPAYYLCQLDTIDQRFLTQDDGLALQEIIYGYRPVQTESSMILMQADPAGRVPRPRSLGRRNFRFGEPVLVPAVESDELLLAQFQIPPSWVGGVRALLYKPPVIQCELKDRNGNALGTRRLVPEMAASPFLFSPLVEDNDAFLGLYGLAPGLPLGSFILTSSWPPAYAGLLDVQFYALPRPRGIDAPTLAGLRRSLIVPFANLTPESITPTFRPNNEVRYLHAPSEIVWLLTGAEREITFDYGIHARAYEEGTTDGVEFIVEIRGPSGGQQRAFARLLQPKTELADRGRHSARVLLPIYAPGSRLVLRTGAGEKNDTAWDWSYVTHVKIQQGGKYAAELFPGFSPVPDRAEDENAGLAELDGAQVLILHVPGTLGFKLTGREKRLTFDFGFLPGAYTGGGHTAGGAFVVELARGGQVRRELFRRTLRPVAETTDRGRQSGAVELSEIMAGDELIVRTEAAVGDNNSWGWTYCARLVIE